MTLLADAILIFLSTSTRKAKPLQHLLFAMALPLPFRSLSHNPSARPSQQVDGSASESVKAQKVQSLRTEFWTLTKSLRCISVLYQTDCCCATDLRHETISRPADSWNQTYLSSAITRYISLSNPAGYFTYLTYLITYLPTYLLTYLLNGTESFLRS